MNAALLAVAALAGYLVGSVSTATLVATRHGVDLRGVGSGNPGATNVGRALGRRTAVLVAVVDVLKGALPATAFGAVAHEAGLVAGVAAVLGHVSSPFLRGRGGRGVATAAGAVLGSHPLWAPLVLLTWVVVLTLSRWVTLASLAAAAAVPVVAVLAGEDLPWAAALMLVVFVRHQANVAGWWSRRRREGRGRSTGGGMSTERR